MTLSVFYKKLIYIRVAISDESNILETKTIFFLNIDFDKEFYFSIRHFKWKEIPIKYSPEQKRFFTSLTIDKFINNIHPFIEQNLLSTWNQIRISVHTSNE
jgi:hypothetical protein